MRSGNFQVWRSSLQAASDRIFSKLLGKSSIVSRASRFWDSLDFWSNLFSRVVSITCSCNPFSGLAAPCRGSGQAAWSVGLASCEQESFFLFPLFHIVKLQSLTKCLNLCALGSQPDAVQVVLSIFLKLRLNVVDLSVQALGKSVWLVWFVCY